MINLLLTPWRQVVITRTNTASYAAEKLVSNSDRTELIDQMAAWLIDTKSTRQMHYLVNDIAKKLLQHKYLFVRITSARKLSQSALNTIDSFLKLQFGKEFTIEHTEIIDPSVVGGVIIDTPTGTLDASVKHKLDRLLKGAI